MARLWVMKIPAWSRRQPDDMKKIPISLSQRYVTALRKHLKQGRHASLQPALRLGRQAVALGLETLELTRIHERALVTLELSQSNNGARKRAEIFLPRQSPRLWRRIALQSRERFT